MRHPNKPLYYVKTPKGIDEIERRTNGLPMRRRKVLIVLDGKHGEKRLAEMFPGDDLPAVLQALLDEEFIRPLVQEAEPAPPAEPLAAPVAAPVAGPKNVPVDDEQRMVMARNFMVNTTRAYIGTNGSSLINQIDGCADLEALRHHFNAWRDAIQLSRDGKKDIADLANKLAALLS